MSRLKGIAINDIEGPKIDARTVGDENKFEELVSSIKRQGIIEPPVVRPLGEGKYEIITGARRVMAAKAAGLAKIECVIRGSSDEQVDMARLDENVFREDLNQVDIARYIEKLMNLYRLTQDEVAKRIGRTGGYVSQMLSLLRKDVMIRDMVEQEQIPYSVGRELLTIPVEQSRQRLARFARDSGANVATVKRWVGEEMSNINREAGTFVPPEQISETDEAKYKELPYPCRACGRVGDLNAMMLVRLCPDCGELLEQTINTGAFSYEPTEPERSESIPGQEPSGPETTPSGNSETSSEARRSERSTETIPGD